MLQFVGFNIGYFQAKLYLTKAHLTLSIQGLPITLQTHAILHSKESYSMRDFGRAVGVELHRILGSGIADISPCPCRGLLGSDTV